MRQIVASVFVMCLATAGCGPAARVAVRDSKRSPEIRKVVVLPFFNGNTLSVEFATKGRLKSPFTTTFVKKAKKRLSERYDFITGEPVEKALKELGTYKGWVKGEGRHQRTGFTVSDAVEVGKALGADAVIIGAGARSETGVLKQLYKSTLTIRLIDVTSGKVVWGATALKRGAFNFSPSTKIIKKLIKEAL